MMDDYVVGRFKAFYNYILYGYDRMNQPQTVNSSCRNNQEQEDGYNAGIAEIAFNRKEICEYIRRRAVEELNEGRNITSIILSAHAEMEEYNGANNQL